MLLNILSLVVVIAATAGLDGLSGRKGGQPFTFVMAFVIAGAVFVLTDSPLAGVLTAVCMVLWRDMPWKWFGGQINPKNNRQVIGLTIRHALPLLPLGFIAPLMFIVAPLFGLAFASYAKDYWDTPDENADDGWATVEAVRGLALGGFFALSLLLYYGVSQ